MLENQTPPPLLLIEDIGMMFPTESSKRKSRYGIYLCHCGKHFESITVTVKNGNTKSCGCYNKRRTTHMLSKHRLYQTWFNMVGRTSNPDHISFKYYGHVGVTVCDRWLNVENFIEDMYPSFIEGLTLDRIDNNKGYFPDNCRWASQSIQSRNTKKIRSNNTSGYRGVSFYKANSKWISSLGIDGKDKHIGYFKTAIEAAKAYDKYVIDNNLEHTINGV